MNLPLPTPDDLGPDWDWKADLMVVGLCLLIVLGLYFGILP